MGTKNKKRISIAAGLLLSLIALFYAFRQVPLQELAASLAEFNYFWGLPATAIVVACIILRVLRWQILLSSAQPVSFWASYHPLVIGFFLNTIMPARIGEIARPAILKQREGVPFATGIASVAAERLFDLLMLLLLFAVVAASVEIDEGLVITFGSHSLNKATLDHIGQGMLKLCLLLLTGITIILIPAGRAFLLRAVALLPALLFFLPKGPRETTAEFFVSALHRLINGLVMGFAAVRDIRKLGLCLLFSIVIWALHAVGMYVLALGSDTIKLSFSELTAIMVIVCFFIALPSAPGYWGLWEAGGVFAMALFGVEAKEAAGFTLINHVIQLLPLGVMGLISVLTTGIDILKTAREGAEKGEDETLGEEEERERSGRTQNSRNQK